MLEWIKVIGPLLLSWPVAALVIALVFRRPLLRLFERFTAADEGKAEIGPVRIELGRVARQGQEAVDQLNRLTALMAESRLLELEITDSMFGRVFSDEQRARMQRHIEELRKVTRPQGRGSTNVV